MNPHPPEAAGRRRWLAHPWMSGLILASWLLLQGGLAPVHWIWGAILALVLPWLAHDFIGPGSQFGAPLVLARLVLTVLKDIVLANLAVARLVLHPGVTPRPAWISVPYTLQDPRAVVLLATIITTTPGTVSAVIDEGRRAILVHALDAPDPQAVIAEILERYERPLKEVFG